MDLSIIIVNWNTKELLLQCLESVDQTTKKIEAEVFIVDNASTDGSAVSVKERFPKTKLIENNINLGFAKANNQAIHQASGNYLLFLNPDTMLKDEAVEKLLTFMHTHPEVGIAGAQLLNLDGTKQNSIANFPSLATELLNKRLLRWLFPDRYPGKEKEYSEPIEVDSVIGACMMVRRNAIEQVGLFDEDYFLFLEETDWCYRMKKAGWKIYHLPQAEVYHLQGKGVEKDKKKAKVEYYQSRYHFFKKNRGKDQWLFLMMGLIIKLIAELIFTGGETLLTFFAYKKWRRRFLLYTYLLWWHLRGCPEGMGLKSLSA